MNGLIQDLIKELQTNPSVKDSIASKVVLESINNSILLGVADSVIVEKALSLLESLSTEMSNKNLKEVVSNFKKLGEKPTARLQNMAREAGIQLKLKAIKESQIYADPVLKNTIATLDEALSKFPEFKVIGMFLEHLNSFSYDKVVAEQLTAVIDYCNANMPKLEVLNSIYEMRIAGSVLYQEPCTILETALLENILTADSLNMKLRPHKNMPVVSKLINQLSMFEAKVSGKFDIGSGNGETKVSSMIAPFLKVSDNDALVFVNNTFIKVSEAADPVIVSNETVFADHKAFYETCSAYSFLNFKQVGNEAVTAGVKIKIALGINENGTLNLKINNSVVDDLATIRLNELFVMENVNARRALTVLFDNMDFIVNAEFGKRIINEKLGREALVFNLGENIYVFERAGNEQVSKKLQGIGFYNYVMENFKYDVSELYSIQLEERQVQIKNFDSEKVQIEESIKKLEGSIAKIEKALNEDKTITQDNVDKMNELKVAIEKNINQLKNQYILIDQAKKNS